MIRSLQRHTAKQLFWRGVVAACANAAMTVGVYPLAPHAARKRLSDGRALALEWGLSLAASWARPIGLFGLPVGLRPRTGPRPIVLLHGYAMNRANYLVLGRRLHRAGLGPLFGFEYWSLGKTSSAARRLREFVERVCDVTGAEQVDVIGHSMGGIVARYYLCLEGGGQRVRNLITLGSPHNGTDVSLFGIGAAKKELSPNSALVERLRASPIPSTTAMTAIWSRGDALVWAARQARLAGIDEIVYDDLGHMGLLASRRVAADIVSILR